jgi:AraC-like DNA-binding protein
MHPKTLSRRLKVEGTSHQQLLDQLRFQLAERYLRDENLSIGEIAFLLGYSDTSSFNKAFKRWTGSAPQHYRQRSAS